MKTKTLLACCILFYTSIFSQSTAPALSNRGMYVNQAYDNIISKPELWTNFFLYCKNNGFTYLNLYGVSGAGTAYPLNTDNNAIDRVNADKAIILSNFIRTSKMYGIEEIGVPVGSVQKTDATVQYDDRGYVTLAQIVSTGVVQYNRSSIYPGKINLLTLEDEWWNDPVDPSARWTNVTKPIIQSMGDARSQFPANFLRTEVYMGFFDNDTISDSLQVAFLEQNINRFLLHHYTKYLSDFMRTSYLDRYLVIGKYASKKMEIWPIFSSQYVPCSGSDYQGNIMTTNPTYNTIDKIENYMRTTYNNKVISGTFSSSQNIYLGGYMWFSYGSCLENFVASVLPNSVSLGRHTLKNFEDCPINIHATTTGTCPFTFYWKFPDGTTATTLNSIKPFDDQLVKGWGKVEVTVYDALGRVSSDYKIIYTDADFYMDCSAVDSLVIHNPKDLSGDEFHANFLQSIDGNTISLMNKNDQLKYKVSLINCSGQLFYKSQNFLDQNQTISINVSPGYYVLLAEDQYGKVSRKSVIF